MRRSRRQAQPEMPKTFQELGDVGEANARFGQLDGKTFCRGTSGKGNSLSVLFLAEGLKYLLAEAKEVHIDGTFKTRPYHPRSAQLLTIMVVYYGFTFPCAFALMPSKTTEAYDEFRPKLVVTDFESELVKSLHKNFPGAHKTVCWFHYCQAVLRKARTLGMTRLLNENVHARNALKMIMCVPLLPTMQISEGVEFVNNFLRLNGLIENFQTLLSYHRTQWLGPILGCLAERVAPTTIRNLSMQR